jgi:hypothetical protein
MSSDAGFLGAPKEEPKLIRARKLKKSVHRKEDRN